MTPDQLRRARKRLGLTQHGLADALGMGKWGWQTVGKWESGKLPIVQRTQLAVESLLKQGK